MLCQSLVGIKLTVNEKCPKNALTDGLKSIVTGHVTSHIHMMLLRTLNAYPASVFYKKRIIRFECTLRKNYNDKICLEDPRKPPVSSVALRDLDSIIYIVATM